jgi:hypothetical protein
MGITFIFSYEIHPSFKVTKLIITSYSIIETDLERAKKYPVVIDLLPSSISLGYLESPPRSFWSDELV